MLKFSPGSSILFPNSVNIINNNVLNSLSDIISVSLFFQGVSFALSTEISFFDFSFCLNSSASTSLGEAAAYCGLA